MLAELGKKLFELFGEKNLGNNSNSSFDEFYKKIAEVNKICDWLPFEGFDETNKLFFNQESIGFVLETPPLVGSSEEMQKELNQLFQYVLPEESNLQVILFADHNINPLLKQWQNARVMPIVQNIAKWRAQYLSSLAYKSPFYPYSLRNFRCLFCYSQKNPGKNPILQAGVQQILTQIKTTLEMLGLPVLVWEPQDLINTVDELVNLNPKKSQPFVKRWDRMQRISDQITDPENNLSIQAEALGIRDNSVKIKTFSTIEMPAPWSLHAMGLLIGDEERDVAQIPCPFMIHYGIHIPKQSQLKASIITKATYVERQASSPIGKFLPAIQNEAEELKFVRDEIGKGGRIVKTMFNLTLFASEDILIRAEQTLKNLYYSKGWLLKANTRFHLPVFLSSLPMMWGEDRVRTLTHHQKLKTTLYLEASNFLPIQGEWKGTKTPGMLLGGRRGQIMTWSPFDNDSGNFNVCVVGRPGSGKSVFMQELMTTTLGLGGKVFVLDVGRSFEKTCYLLAGQFIEFKAKTPLCLNPFSTIPLDDMEAEADALAMVKPVLILMAAPTKGVDDLESALLEQALLETWKQHQQDSNISHIADYLLKHKDKKAQDLGTMLFPYTEKGTYGRFFNGPSTVNLENPLVVVELEELKERKDLQAVVVQMVIINITTRMFLGDRKTPFVIVIDEAWDLLRGKQSADFIETLARRVRKYRGALVVGTQSINDFFTSLSAQAAFDNSDWMCLLSQKKESIEQLKKQSRISLTPLMEAQLKSVKTKQGQYSEVMIYGSQGYAIGRLLLDPYSQLLYSTKAQDFSQVQSLRDQGLSVHEALETILNDKK